MKNRYCNMCNKPLLIDNKIVTRDKELLTVKIYGIEHNWCNDDCYEKWYEREIDDHVTYVTEPSYFKD